jgi:hypothetical protein
VTAPIIFYNKANRMAVEVDDGAVNNLLASEMKPTQAIGAQSISQFGFRKRHLALHGFRPCQEFG